MKEWNSFQKKWNHIYHMARLLLLDAMSRDYGMPTIPDCRNFKKIPWRYEVLNAYIPARKQSLEVAKTPFPDQSTKTRLLHLDRYYIDERLTGQRMVTEAAYNEYDDTVYYKEWKFI